MQYKIKKGDTLSAIAKKLGIPMKDLAEANDIKDVDKIYAGANLIIPTPKKKKASTVERVIPEEKKEVKTKRYRNCTIKS
jgi:LysM repeat protein